MFANVCIHAEDDLLDTSIELTDKGVVLAAKMKIAFSLSPGSDEEFMKRVDDDVGHMSSLPNCLSTLGQVLKSTKTIMDRVSQVVHLLSLIVNRLINLIRYTRYSMHRGPLCPVFTR